MIRISFIIPIIFLLILIFIAVIIIIIIVITFIMPLPRAPVPSTCDQPLTITWYFSYHAWFWSSPALSVFLIHNQIEDVKKNVIGAEAFYTYVESFLLLGR